jgi:hypothetical protein
MFKARHIKEIVVEVRNDIGVLHEMTRIVADKGISIVALQGTVDEERAVIRMVTDDMLRTADALRARNYKPLETDAILAEVPHKAGMLRVMTEKLGKANIDIDLIYGSAGNEASHCMVVLSTSDNDRAIVELNR